MIGLQIFMNTAHEFSRDRTEWCSFIRHPLNANFTGLFSYSPQLFSSCFSLYGSLTLINGHMGRGGRDLAGTGGGRDLLKLMSPVHFDK